MKNPFWRGETRRGRRHNKIHEESEDSTQSSFATQLRKSMRSFRKKSGSSKPNPAAKVNASTYPPKKLPKPSERREEPAHREVREPAEKRQEAVRKQWESSAPRKDPITTKKVETALAAPEVIVKDEEVWINRFLTISYSSSTTNTMPWPMTNAGRLDLRDDDSRFENQRSLLCLSSTASLAGAEIGETRDRPISSSDDIADFPSELARARPLTGQPPVADAPSHLPAIEDSEATVDQDRLLAHRLPFSLEVEKRLYLSALSPFAVEIWSENCSSGCPVPPVRPTQIFLTTGQGRGIIILSHQKPCSLAVEHLKQAKAVQAHPPGGSSELGPLFAKNDVTKAEHGDHLYLERLVSGCNSQFLVVCGVRMSRDGLSLCDGSFVAAVSFREDCAVDLHPVLFIDTSSQVLQTERPPQSEDGSNYGEAHVLADQGESDESGIEGEAAVKCRPGDNSPSYAVAGMALAGASTMSILRQQSNRRLVVATLMCTLAVASLWIRHSQHQRHR